jgi:hypothetical protein
MAQMLKTWAPLWAVLLLLTPGLSGATPPVPLPEPDVRACPRFLGRNVFTLGDRYVQKNYAPGDAEWSGEVEVMNRIGSRNLKNFRTPQVRGTTFLNGHNDSEGMAVLMDQMPGSTLGNLSYDQLRDAVPAVARALAEFHRLFPPAEYSAFSAQIRQLRQWGYKSVQSMAVRVLSPEDAQSLLALGQAYIERTDDDLVFAHADAHLENLMWDGKTLSIIDLEGATHAWAKDERGFYHGIGSSGRDLGRFMEALYIRGLRAGWAADATVSLQRLFLETYAAARGMDAATLEAGANYHRLHFLLLSADDARGMFTPVVRQRIREELESRLRRR